MRNSVLKQSDARKGGNATDGGHKSAGQKGVIMVVHLMNEDKLIDLDELQLFGMFRECDEETERAKYGEVQNDECEDRRQNQNH